MNSSSLLITSLNSLYSDSMVRPGDTRYYSFGVSSLSTYLIVLIELLRADLVGVDLVGLNSVSILFLLFPGSFLGPLFLPVDSSFAKSFLVSALALALLCLLLPVVFTSFHRFSTSLVLKY